MTRSNVLDFNKFKRSILISNVCKKYHTDSKYVESIVTQYEKTGLSYDLMENEISVLLEYRAIKG